MRAPTGPATVPATDTVNGTVNVATLELDLDPLVWKDGGTLTGVRPFSLRMWQLHERAQRPDAAAADVMALLRLCVPDGTPYTRIEADGTVVAGTVDEDYRLDLTPFRVWAIFEHAQLRLREAVQAVEDARKNGRGAAADVPAPPSAPTTSSSSPSPASGASRAATGGRGRKPRSTASSTPSTA